MVLLMKGQLQLSQARYGAISQVLKHRRPPVDISATFTLTQICRYIKANVHDDVDGLDGDPVDSDGE